MLHQNNNQLQKKSRVYVILICSVAALGGLLFGYDTAVISGAIGFLRIKFELNAAQMGWAASCALVGCIMGCIIAGAFSDRYGRKKALLFSALLYLISAIGSALTHHLTEFVIYRMVGGIAVGAASMLSPLYIAEVSPAHIRGRMVSLNQLAIVSGIFVVYFVNYFIVLQGSETWNIQTGWRWMFGSEGVPAIIFFILLIFIPESPRWLIKQNQNQKAFHILKKLNPKGAEQEAKFIQETISQETCTFKTLFGPRLRFVLFLGIGLAVLQQVTGINVFLYYAPEIFKKLGAGMNVALIQTIVIGFFNVGFTFIAIKNVDKFGRKLLILIGSTGMGFCLFGMGLAAYFGVISLWILIFVLGYVAFFSLSVGPVVWVILSEIFPTKIRGRAMSAATVCLWAANWLVSQTFPMMDENSWLVSRFHHGFAFWIYGLMCIALVIVVQKWVPETKGKSLEEIEKLLGCS